jgi:hypothetical protein
MERLLFLIIVFLAGCMPNQQTTPIPIPALNSPTPMSTPENPYASQPNDAKLEKSPAFIEEAGVQVMGGRPQQFQLHLSGNLPDPCHELRIAISEPDEAMNIKVDVFSVVDPAMMCIQVLKPFSTNLELGSFPTGHYTVTVNGEIMAEFDA